MCNGCEKNIEHKQHSLIARPFDYGVCLLCKNGVEHSEHEITTIHSNGKQRWEKGKEKRKVNKDKGDKRGIGDCSICGIKLLHGKFQIQHYRKEHPNDKIFNCKDCSYATNYLPNLNTHASSMHDKKVRQCSLCSYSTTWHNSFLEHMRSTHGLFQNKSKHSVKSEALPILCDNCGFSTFNQEQFNAHKLANCQSKPYEKIKKSHMSYNPSIKLKPEMRYSSGIGNFKCNKCAFSSDKPADIRDHVQKVHARLQLRRDDEKFTNPTSNQDIKFKCIKCKYQTSEPTQLRDHMSIHN